MVCYDDCWCLMLKLSNSLVTFQLSNFLFILLWLHLFQKKQKLLNKTNKIIRYTYQYNFTKYSSLCEAQLLGLRESQWSFIK